MRKSNKGIILCLQYHRQEAGFQLTEKAGDIDIVVASFDRTFGYHKLQVAFDAIRAGARLVATNGDRYCPVPGGGQPDAAAIIGAVEGCTSVRCDPIVGKPSSIMVSMIMDFLKLLPKCCIMVAIGWRSIFRWVSRPVWLPVWCLPAIPTAKNWPHLD